MVILQGAEHVDLCSNVVEDLIPIAESLMTVMNGTQQQEAPRPLKLGGHVGFDSLPDQLVNKS